MSLLNNNPQQLLLLFIISKEAVDGCVGREGQMHVFFHQKPPIWRRVIELSSFATSRWVTDVSTASLIRIPFFCMNHHGLLQAKPNDHQLPIGSEQNGVMIFFTCF